MVSEGSNAVLIRAHPQGVQPMGNALGLPANQLRRHIQNLGSFRVLSDNDLLEILPKIALAYAELGSDEGKTPKNGNRGAAVGACLARLGQTSTAFNIVTRQESLWKELFLAISAKETPWRRRARIDSWIGSWRDTFLAQHAFGGDETAIHRWLMTPRRRQRQSRRRFRYFSDILYHPFHMASLSLETYFAYLQDRTHRNPSEPPAKRRKQNDSGQSKLVRRRKAFNPIPRVSAKETTLEKFHHDHCARNFPAIVDASGTEGWPCKRWSLDQLVASFGHPKSDGKKARIFAAEGFECTLGAYLQYARSCATFDLPESQHDEIKEKLLPPWLDPEAVADESPTYLFDSTFAEDDIASKDWRIPEFLRTVPSSTSQGQEEEDAERLETKADLFRLFGKDKRPDYRWIIAGPRRSGSGWHKDPNMTSAWNAIMKGSKLWLMLPPDTRPPGVYVTPDEAEVTAPLSISEWVHDWYDETKKKHGPTSIGGDGKLLEGVCEAGETVYVPSGWWHLVINLEECVALTQNFVSVYELPAVLRFLRNKPDQISGFKGCDDGAEDDQGDQRPTETNGASEHSALFGEFYAKLQEFDPALLAWAIGETGDKIKSGCETGNVRESVAPTKINPKSKQATDALPASFALELDADELEEVPW